MQLNEVGHAESLVFWSNIAQKTLLNSRLLKIQPRNSPGKITYLRANNAERIRHIAPVVSEKTQLERGWSCPRQRTRSKPSRFLGPLPSSKRYAPADTLGLAALRLCLSLVAGVDSRSMEPTKHRSCCIFSDGKTLPFQGRSSQACQICSVLRVILGE